MERDLLDELRSDIDRVNKVILQALNDRLEIARKIGAEKKKRHLPILDEDRERKVINSIIAENSGPISDDDLASVFRLIMRISRDIQA